MWTPYACPSRGRGWTDTNNCVATGLGKDIFGDKGEYQTIMQQVTLPKVQHSYCQQALSKSRLGRWRVSSGLSFSGKA